MRRPTAAHWWWISWIMLTVFFAAVVLTLIFMPAAVVDKGNQLAGILGSLVGIASLIVSVVAARIASRYAAHGTQGGAGLMLDRAAVRLALSASGSMKRRHGSCFRHSQYGFGGLRPAGQ